MMILIAGLLLFLGSHSTRICADDWRSRQIERLGILPWKAAYSVVAIAGFALIVWGFGLARSAPVIVWTPPVWARHVTATLMLLSFILLVAAYVPGNRIKANIGHPMLAATKTWAVAHLLANGTLADIVLFGAFLVWAVVCFVVSRRRDRMAGVRYPVAGVGWDLLVVGLGVAGFGLFAIFGHQWLIGVRPFG